MKNYKASFRNRGAIEHSHVCGCYFCIRTFPSVAIEEWTDDGQTALCPHCDMDAVLAEESTDLSRANLERMCERWFASKIS